MIMDRHGRTTWPGWKSKVGVVLCNLVGTGTEQIQFSKQFGISVQYIEESIRKLKEVHAKKIDGQQSIIYKATHSSVDTDKKWNVTLIKGCINGWVWWTVSGLASVPVPTKLHKIGSELRKSKEGLDLKLLAQAV